MTVKKDHIKCPICGKAKTWKSDNPSRPFCSPRCKLIDLGEWAEESRRLPGDPISPTDDEEKE